MLAIKARSDPSRLANGNPRMGTESRKAICSYVWKGKNGVPVCGKQFNPRHIGVLGLAPDHLAMTTCRTSPTMKTSCII